MNWFTKKIIIHRWLGRFKSFFLTFLFNKQSYHYFYHLYNSAWRKHQSTDVLEVGNVLAHYFPTTHQVIDKYEKGKNVKNIDVVDFKSRKKYSLIVSISTLEHIGYDESVRDSQKSKKALKKLIRHLKPGGELWVTFPLGYNPHLDKLLQKGGLPLDKLFFLKRISLFGTWKEVPEDVIKEKPEYGFPFSNANLVCVGMLKSN